MMASKVSEFITNWQGKNEPTLAEKIKTTFKPSAPLRHRIIMANYKLRTMINKLEAYINKLQERDRALFERVVEAQMNKDVARATMYANEIAEIRKITKQMMVTQIALEQVQLRLETVMTIGDIVTDLVPVIGVVRELKNSIKTLMPEMSFELSEIEESLQEVIHEVGEFMPGGAEVVVASPEAKKILEEAQVIAEQRMKERFPSLPTFITSAQQVNQNGSSK
ncbi:MAG: Snf7 family protein [Sulfolobales archaeon]|nr:Snf7 family protein [Sulfolobales archaeon]MCG2893539.1 Snf7 family protein [Sulfolobales archaeon]MCG2910065.1 Snf7 family protein [Sulfolobales archaeon]